jgi:hypothetical protein
MVNGGMPYVGARNIGASDRGTYGAFSSRIAGCVSSVARFYRLLGGVSACRLRINLAKKAWQRTHVRVLFYSQVFTSIHK